MTAAAPRQVLGNYVIERELGRGGMGAIYLGIHRTLGKRAAIKVLLPELSRREDLIQRFWSEARAVTAVHHPSIVDVYDYGTTDDGSTYIVMEHLEGESLGARLKSHGLLPIPQAVAIGRQIANALAAAHAVGVVHRDLKPDNIFLVEDSEVAGGRRAKLLDFGVAKLVASEDDGTAKTITGALLGTPHYMSPEQCEGARAVDHRSDLYSLGCTLFYMVSGRLPFESPGIGGLIGMHLHVPPPKLRDRAPHASHELERIVARLLEKQPDARFASAAEVAAALSTPEATEVDAAASAPLPRQIVHAEVATAATHMEPLSVAPSPLAATQLAEPSRPPTPPPPSPTPSPRPPAARGKTRWAWLAASVGTLGVVAIAVTVAKQDAPNGRPDTGNVVGGNVVVMADAASLQQALADGGLARARGPDELAEALVVEAAQANWLVVGELAKQLVDGGTSRATVDQLLSKFSKQAVTDMEARITKLAVAGDCATALLEAQQFAMGWGKLARKVLARANLACGDAQEAQSEAFDDINEAFDDDNFAAAYAKCKAQKQLPVALRFPCVAAACVMKQAASARTWAVGLPKNLLDEVVLECGKRGIKLAPSAD